MIRKRPPELPASSYAQKSCDNRNIVITRRKIGIMAKQNRPGAQKAGSDDTQAEKQQQIQPASSASSTSKGKSGAKSRKPTIGGTAVQGAKSTQPKELSTATPVNRQPEYYNREMRAHAANGHRPIQRAPGHRSARTPQKTPGTSQRTPGKGQAYSRRQRTKPRHQTRPPQYLLPDWHCCLDRPFDRCRTDHQSRFIDQKLEL